jgi:hypothetical protein
MNTLVYKRTHTGDPNKQGVFGCHDCMGRIRRRSFDAVIGVGGKRPDRGHEDIAFKITWVGMGPIKAEAPDLTFRGPLVEFERFVLWDETGPDLKALAPRLFKHLFEDAASNSRRSVMSESLSGQMQEEISNILRLAERRRDDARGNRGGPLSPPKRTEPRGAQKRTSPTQKCRP